MFRNSSVVLDEQRYHHAAVCEFHAGDSVFRNNTIESYASVVIPSENYIEPWSGLVIEDNTASDLGRFFVHTQVQMHAKSKPIDGITIHRNTVTFNKLGGDQTGPP